MSVQVKIGGLPEFTGDSSGSFLLINDASNTATYRIKKETYFTGSLFGTASWAQNSLTASYAQSVLFFTASNGLTKTGSNVELGGTLYKDTAISGSNYSITFRKTLLQYAADVSQFYTSRSFVDKGYVDNNITRLATGSATASLSTTQLTVNVNTVISGSLTVSGSGNLTGFLVMPAVSSSLNYADDSAAQAGGVPLGGIYRNGGELRLRVQ